MKKSFTADWPLLVQHVVATSRGPYQEDHAGALARCGSSGELLDVPTLASVAWYFCFQMWLSLHSAPVIGLYPFPRFMSIDNNGGANSHAPCVMVVSQPLRSLGRHWGASAWLCGFASAFILPHSPTPSPPPPP